MFFSLLEVNWKKSCLGLRAYVASQVSMMLWMVPISPLLNLLTLLVKIITIIKMRAPQLFVKFLWIIRNNYWYFHDTPRISKWLSSSLQVYILCSSPIPYHGLFSPQKKMLRWNIFINKQRVFFVWLGDDFAHKSILKQLFMQNIKRGGL
jgi:hypothetical protein